MKNYLNLMRFDLITAVCSAGNRPAAAALLIAAAYLILVFLGVPLISIALYIGGVLLIAPLQGAAENAHGHSGAVSVDRSQHVFL